MSNETKADWFDLQMLAADAAWALFERGTNYPRITRIMEARLSEAQRIGYTGDIGLWSSFVMKRCALLFEAFPQGRRMRRKAATGSGDAKATAFAA